MKTPALLLTLTALSTPAVAQDSATSPPVGYHKIAIRALADSAISLPLLEDAADMARVASVTNNVVRVSGRAWAVGQFAQDPEFQPVPYRLWFFSGALQGVNYPVTNSTADGLWLDTGGENLAAHRLGAAQAGDIVAIRPDWTVGGIFGEGASNVVLNGFAAEATTHSIDAGDTVRLFDDGAPGVWKRPSRVYYHQDSEGWRALGAGQTNHADAGLPAGMGFVVRRADPQPVELVLMGNADTRRSVALVPGGGTGIDNEALIALTQAEPIALDDAALVATNGVIVPSVSAMQRGDELWFFSETRPGFERPAERAFVYVDGTGWREVGSESTTVGQDVKLEPGKAYQVRKAAGTAETDWILMPGY